MASGSLPPLHIHGTSATDGGQSFAGLNFGTINYDKGDSKSSLNDILNTLPTSKDAPFNAYQRQHDPTCLRDTRVDLLHEIHDWVDSEHSPAIFWLSGLAGTGKSTIAQTVATHYHTKGRLAASFFFSRVGGDVSHAGMFVTSIAVQIANSIPASKHKICDAIAKHNNIASQSLNDQWQELVLGPLSSLEEGECRPNYVLVIDALDECDSQNNVQIILQRLAEVQFLQGIQLRVFVTSRPEVPIQYGFTQVRRDKHQDFVLHDIAPTIVEHDISVFLSHKLEHIRHKYQLRAGWPEKSAIERLVENSGGLFIWAATACRFIEEHSQLAETRLSSLLRQENHSMLPPERKLDEIYTTVLTNSVQATYDEAESQTLYKLFRQIVGPIVTLQDSLSVTNLAELIKKDAVTLRRTLASLNSVIHVPTTESNPVRLLHPSFRDFLVNRKRCLNSQFHIEEQLVHSKMYRHCVRLMSKRLQRNICNLRDPGVRVADLSRTEIDKYIQPELQYACRFWVHHCIRSDIDTRRCSDIEVFFQEHFLHWLELLILISRGSDAVHMLDEILSNLEEDCQTQSKFRDRIKDIFLTNLNLKAGSAVVPHRNAARPSLRDVVHDAIRFVLAFRPVLEKAPLQLYYTGLIFSPKSSIIKKIYSKDHPAWLLSGPRMAENWSPCLQTLKGHSSSVNAMAFSPDGKTLASGSHDMTIRLWDAVSGKALQTLKGHSSTVLDVAFSPDGKTLVSGSYDKTIRLWDTGSGKALQKLKGHSDLVKSVAFSPIGKRLASGSHDKTVKLWDATSGKALQTLKGHSDLVNSVAFSPNGKMLASGSHDKAIRLWDVSSGKALQTLKGHSDLVNSVAFSPNGKTLASGSFDKAIRLWDSSSGKALQTLKGHLDFVYTVAFSPNGKTLASGSFDETIRLWDTSSGKALQKLKGHGSSVCAVVFSPDGKTLASGSYDETIRLWDSGLGKALQTLRGHSDEVCAMVFSPNGKTLASGSYDKTIRLWDSSSGKALQTLKGHSDVIKDVVFSPDGKTLASGSHDNTIRLWDAGSGKALQTLKGHSNLVFAVAFSPDGKTLASGSNNDTIRLWDTGSGKALQTLRCHSDLVTAVVFSPDGKTLASVSLDETIRLWDSSSGKALQTLKGHSSTLDALWPQSPSPLLLSVEDDWICRNGKRVLWIPSEYRPSIVAVHNNVVGFGYTSGQVLILKFVT